MSQARRWRGLTWDHPRGHQALRAAVADSALIAWDVHSLEGFESAPIEDLCARYDLIVLDHPHLGAALAHDCLRPLDEVFDAADLVRIAGDSIGRTYESYTMAGRQWALPLDAATQVMAVRPDLLASASLPRDWDAVLALSALTGRVAMSLAGPHAYLSMLSIAAALDPAVDLRDGGRWHRREVTTEACRILAELARRSPASVRALNPIGLLTHMSVHDEVLLCPLVYGYVNYSSPAVPHPVAFHDAPQASAGVPGSTLGGTGIAISRRCTPDAALREHLLWLMSEQAQRDFIPSHAGQPSHRRAWADAQVNAASLGFYAQTARTLAAASIRPRDAGYIARQDAGSALLRDAFASGTPPAAIAAELERLMQAGTYPDHAEASA